MDRTWTVVRVGGSLRASFKRASALGVNVSVEDIIS